MRSLIFIFTVIALFIGCTKIPEKTDIEKNINGIVSELEEEKAAKCGDGIKDEWEECDFEGTISCSAYDSGTIGPAKCQNCKLDLSECKIKEICDAEFCNSNGTCREIRYLNEIFCDCVNNIIGENCNECSYGFYLEDKTCKTSSCTSDTCSSYERCVSTSGEKPVCVCRTNTQDPNDCSKCLPGYDWALTSYNETNCVNSQIVDCTSNPDKPENSQDISSSVTITYTDENGWSEPEYCEWICHEGLMKDSGSCINPYIKQYTLNGYPYVAGFDESNNLLVIYVSSMYSVSKTEMKKISELGSSFTGGIIGNDRNIYLRNKYSSGVYFRNSDEFLKISSSVTDSQNMSILNSAVFFGNSYLDFPEINYINGEIIDENASSISDKDGNILTVYNNGTVKLNKSDFSIIWKKDYSEYLFSKNPVIDSQENVHIPCRNNSKSCILTIRLSNGSIVEKFEFPDSSEISHQPAISIGSNLKKYAVQGGVLTILDKDNNILAETSKVVPKQLTTNDFAPVVTDRGLIYFSNYESVVCVNEAGEQIWIQDTDNIVYSFFHHDNTLYVFNGSGVYLYNAPGNISGDWPQLLHDARKSGSLSDISFVDPPSAPVALTPEDNAVFNTNSVTFSWGIDSSDPNIKYTLLLRYSTSYDKVYAGPEIGLTTATVNDLAAGSYEWRVVSKDENGSLNVSDARTFTVE